MLGKPNAITEDDKFYLLQSGSSHKIKKDSGMGRVLKHLLDNKNKIVSLEKVTELSGWRYPRKHMKEKLIELIDIASPYEIKTIYGYQRVDYMLIDKPAEENPYANLH